MLTDTQILNGLTFSMGHVYASALFILVWVMTLDQTSKSPQAYTWMSILAVAYSVAAWGDHGRPVSMEEWLAGKVVMLHFLGYLLHFIPGAPLMRTR